MDKTNGGNLVETGISSKQLINNRTEGHYKTDWGNKMQDTENFPILRT